jgi:cob(I)alamin adenosyltransferase
MGFRLTRIYTRTGDDGSTGLADGSRVPKDDTRIEAIGAIDELNSALGLLLAESLPGEIRSALERVQHTLFDLGGELAVPGRSVLDKQQVTDLEQFLDQLNTRLDPLREFILPGGTRAAALCHLARSICRRAERRLVTLGRHATVAPVGRHFLNRLSDLLFVIARDLNRASGSADVPWQPAPKR